MKVKCERDGTIFEAIPKKYPSEKKQTTFYRKDGDLYIDCVMCCRRYFLYGNSGDFISDRKLTILGK